MLHTVRMLQHTSGQVGRVTLDGAQSAASHTQLAHDAIIASLLRQTTRTSRCRFSVIMTLLLRRVPAGTTAFMAVTQNALLPHRGREKMATILHTTFSNSLLFICMKIIFYFSQAHFFYLICMKINSNLSPSAFLALIKPAPDHYLSQWQQSFLPHFWPWWVKSRSLARLQAEHRNWSPLGPVSLRLLTS